MLLFTFKAWDFSHDWHVTEGVWTSCPCEKRSRRNQQELWGLHQWTINGFWQTHRLIMQLLFVSNLSHSQSFLLFRTTVALVRSSLHSSVCVCVCVCVCVFVWLSPQCCLHLQPHHITDKTPLSLVCSGDLTQSYTTVVSAATSKPVFHPLCLCLSTAVNTASVNSFAQSHTLVWLLLSVNYADKRISSERAGWVTYALGWLTLPDLWKLILRAAGLLLALRSQHALKCLLKLHS